MQTGTLYGWGRQIYCQAVLCEIHVGVVLSNALLEFAMCYHGCGQHYSLHCPSSCTLIQLLRSIIYMQF